MKLWFKLSTPAENSWMQNSVNSQEICNCSSCIVFGCNSFLRSAQIKIFGSKLIRMGEVCEFEGVCGFTVASSAVSWCRHPVRWTILVLRVLGGTEWCCHSSSSAFSAVDSLFSLCRWLRDIQFGSVWFSGHCSSQSALVCWTHLWQGSYRTWGTSPEEGLGGAAWQTPSVGELVHTDPRAAWTLWRSCGRGLAQKTKLGPFLLTEFCLGGCLRSAEAFFSSEWKKNHPKTNNY